MPISRSLLHENKVDAFKVFLQSKGWTIEKTKGFYEVIRATKKGQKTIVLLQRTGTKHITIGWDMEHAYKLIKEFVYQRRDNNEPR